MEKETDLRRVTVYCDGACRGNPGLGAWAAILVCEGCEKEITAAAERTTNNRMELEAAIRALETLNTRCRVQVVTDSQYVHKGMTEWVEGWKRRGWRKARGEKVLNRDLWEKLTELAEKHEVHWQWVRGHRGHPFNERCDRLANRAMDDFLAERRTPSGG